MDRIGFLEAMLRIPSLSGREGELAAWLVGQMTSLGLTASIDPVGNAVGVAGPAGAAKTILLLGHMDTVRGQIPIRRENGCLYGRGAVDAKGPLAAMVLAAASVAQRLKNTRVVVIGAIEEEAHGRGAQYLRETMDPPDCVVIGEPSGWEGITLGYKGLLAVHHRWESSVSHGAADHRTPAEHAVGFWDHVREQADVLNDGRTGAFGTVAPSLREIHTFSDGIRAWSEMDVVLRLPPDMPPSAVCEVLVARHPDERVMFPYAEPAYRSEKNSPLVRAFLCAIRAAFGRPRFKLKTGTSDMNVVGPAWGCPIVAYGPGDSNLDHTPDEHVEVAEFDRGVEILIDALDRLVRELEETEASRVASAATEAS
jgi:LysW-gamma-L-lysine carboxypeptidase